MDRSHYSAQIFAGVRVIELAQYVFVPGGGVLLADFGAEVIKVEEVGTGDPYRTLSIGDGREKAEVNVALEQNNRGKKSIAINLKTAEGREVLGRLIAGADVFLTNFRPSALERLKLDVEDVRAWNSNIIYARGNGLGYRGAERDLPGYDSTSFWARGGFASSLTAPDFPAMVRSRGALGDHTGSLSVAFGIASALFRRERTGIPSVVDVSLLSTALWVLSADVPLAHQPGYDQFGSLNRQPRFPLVRSHRTRDGRYIQLAFLQPDKHWADLCHTLELGELAQDPRFCERNARSENGAECTRIIAERIASRDWADWKPRFDELEAPWALAQTLEEVARDPQAHANGMIVETPMSNGSVARLVAGPVAIDEEVPQYRRAPKLGEDTDALLAELGFDEGKVAALKESKVVRGMSPA